MSSDWLFLLDSEWSIPPGSNTSMEDLKTFKGKIFWKLVYPVKVNVDGVVYELNYYVDIDAISGNILEIAHDVY